VKNKKCTPAEMRKRDMKKLNRKKQERREKVPEPWTMTDQSG